VTYHQFASRLDEKMSGAASSFAGWPVLSVGRRRGEARWRSSPRPGPACCCACATGATPPPGASSSTATPRWSTATCASAASRTPTPPTWPRTSWRAARANRLRGSGDTDAQHLLEEAPAPEGGEAEWQAEWERQVFTWACTLVRGEVSDTTWQAFWRTAFDGQPGKQVAADLGMTLTAVYRARSRVLARIKELVRSAQEP
jgi:hypothetical protein